MFEQEARFFLKLLVGFLQFLLLCPQPLFRFLQCARLVLELSKSRLTQGSPLYWYANINFLHFAALLFVLCSLILIVVSIMTPPPPADRVADLTMQTVAPSAKTEVAPKERSLEIGLSVLLAATIGALWIVFR